MTEDATPSPSDKKAASPPSESSLLPSQENTEPSDDSKTEPELTAKAEPQPTIEAVASTEINPTKHPRPKNSHVTEPPLERWQLVWDVVIFQGKLLLDGGRDLLLSPLSIILAIYALITGKQAPGQQFYDLMHIGHRTDRWINLFGAAKRAPPSEFSSRFLNSFGDEDTDDQNVDNLVSHMEEMVKKQYEKGGVTASAKTNIDKAFDKLNAKIHPHD